MRLVCYGNTPLVSVVKHSRANTSNTLKHTRVTHVAENTSSFVHHGFSMDYEERGALYLKCSVVVWQQKFYNVRLNSDISRINTKLPFSQSLSEHKQAKSNTHKATLVHVCVLKDG